MRKLLSLCLLFSLLLLASTTLPSCSKKTGCPINENAHIKPNRKGKMPTKRGKSNLFPKDMRKKKKG
ncbi:MAG: hypothetical protein AAGG75_21900 [Bacteroidota bacterium]